DRLLSGVHDVSDGGLGVALAEMVARSGIGAVVDGVGSHARLFAEAPSRVVVCVAEAAAQEVTERANRAGIQVVELGEAGGDRLVIGEIVDLQVADIVDAW